MAAAEQGESLWEAVPGAARSPLAYQRREPEKTLLHAVVRERLETFLDAARERSSTGRGLPSFVEQSFRRYLACGILARGFARVRCAGCGFERLVAFSCKAQICPSCAARRMEDGAAHLVRNVFPAIAVRQWVLSFPRRLRFLAAREPRLASRLLAIFTGAVFTWQRRQARKLGVASPQTGGVTAIQRFGGALNLNVHLHTVLPDGVFDLSGSGPARFVPLAAPSDEEIDRILRRIIRRAARVVAACDANPEDRDDALAELQATEVDRGQRLAIALPHQLHSAMLDGFSLHAGVHIHANDHEGREKLLRYILRPPLALHRLSMGEGGRLLYRMKRPRAGGLVLSLTPDELLARLATLVPPPRAHGVRYHGVFAPNSKLRSRVVPPAPSADTEIVHCRPRGTQPKSPPAEGAARSKTRRKKPEPERSYRVPWAELLQKVFAIDVLDCPKCSGRMKLIAFITGEGVARQILEHLALPTTGPPTAKAARMVGDEREPAPAYDQVDPTWNE